MSEQKPTEGISGSKTSLSDYMERIENPDTDETSTDESNTDDSTENTDDDSTSDSDSAGDSKSEDSSAVLNPEDYFADSDGKFKIPKDAKFKVGEAEVSAKDLFNAFETREQISRRFADVGNKEKRLAKDREEIEKEKAEFRFINQKFKEMAEEVQNGNTIGAMQIALSMQPDADATTVEGLINKSIELAAKFESMSEGEQKAFIKTQELDQQSRDLKRKQKALDDAEENKNIRAHYDNVLNAHQITEDELASAFDDIQKMPKFAEELAEQDKLGRINYCATWLLGKRFRSRVQEGISRVDAKDATDQTLVLALIEILDPNCTVEDAAEVYSIYKGRNLPPSANGNAAASKSVDKSTTSDAAPTEKPKAKEKKTAPVLKFSDLIAKYS